LKSSVEIYPIDENPIEVYPIEAYIICKGVVEVSGFNGLANEITLIIERLTALIKIRKIRKSQDRR
jgi:hypothetical protein